MIHPKTIEFLHWLEEFNDKKFFNLYKPLYEEIIKKFKEFSSFLVTEIAKTDLNIEWTDFKKCIFRIYRDARFSKNKDPYKTNLWVFVAPGGKASIYAWYYVHIQPGKSFFWWGIFIPTTENAYKIRNYISSNWKEFEKIRNEKKFKTTFKDLYTYQPPLKKTPKWFDEKDPAMKYVKFKDWLVNDIQFSDEEVLLPDFPKKIVKFCEIMYPMNEFLNKAIRS